MLRLALLVLCLAVPFSIDLAGNGDLVFATQAQAFSEGEVSGAWDPNG